MKTLKTRRESLSVLGAVGWAALSGCGGSNETGEGNPAGTSGTNDGGSGGSAGGGGSPGVGGSDASAGEGTVGASGGSGTAGDGTAGEGAAGEGAGGAASECAAKTETVIGPYPTSGPLERKDVRGNTTGDTTPKLGALLTLRVRVLDRDDIFCGPIEGAMVEIWQCDAVGAYAGYAAFNTVGQDFCRGAQRTDATGVAELLTIYPGSYAGRSVHIHFSIRKDAGSLPGQGIGQSLPDVFVAQLYFTNEITAEIFAANAVYQQGAAITPNESDGIFPSGGADFIVDVTSSGGGYVGEVSVPVRRSEIGL